MIAVVGEHVEEAEPKRMDLACGRGVRFNLINVGGPSRDVLIAVARRIPAL